MKKKSLRVLAALTAFAILAFIIYVATSFVGDPFTKYTATKAIQTYLDATYPNEDFILDSTDYDFKLGEYCGNIISPSSEDSHFIISWKKGGTIEDTYEFDVTSKWNTVQRYEREAASQIRTLFSTVTTIVPEELRISYESESFELLDPKDIELDSAFDKSMHLPLKLSLTAASDSPTLEEYATILTDLHNTLKSNGFYIKYYTISSKEDCSLAINAYDISPETIESGKLLSLLEKAENADDVPNVCENYKNQDVSVEKISVNSFERTN